MCAWFRVRDFSATLITHSTGAALSHRIVHIPFVMYEIGPDGKETEEVQMVMVVDANDPGRKAILLPAVKLVSDESEAESA